MGKLTELIVNCITFWLYIQAGWVILGSVVYFEIPWLFWGALFIAAIIQFFRVPPPSQDDVSAILGIEPQLNTSESNKNGMNEQYCMKYCAHRGGGLDYPENSMSAFRNCKEQGCTAVEFDVTLTKDKVPIVFHDTTIDRLTNEAGVVEEMTWKELEQLDISVNHPLRDRFEGGEKIAQLEEVVQECLRNRQRIFFDIKAKGFEIVDVIVNLFQKYPDLYRTSAISGFNPITVYLIRRKNPRIMGCLAWRPNFISMSHYTGVEGGVSARYTNPLSHILARISDIMHDWAISRFTYYLLGISVIFLHKDVVSPDVIRWWQDRGVRVLVWTVNLPSEKTFFGRILKVTYLTDTLLSEKVI